MQELICNMPIIILLFDGRQPNKSIWYTAGTEHLLFDCPSNTIEKITCDWKKEDKMWVEVALFFLLLLTYAILRDRKPKNMPPGPLEIPFFGNPPLETTEDLAVCRKKYGNIYTVRLGQERTVVLTNYKTSKEVMAGLDFIDRPEFFKTFNLQPELDGGGLFASNGKHWVHDRRFVLRHLRDLGMGKTYLEAAIQEEAQYLVEELKNLNEKPVSHPRCLRTAVLNIIWQLVAGHRYPHNSKDVDAIFNILEKLREESIFVLAEGFFPFLKKVPLVVKNLFFNSYIVNDFQNEMTDIIQKSVVEHEKNLDEDNPRDLIDEYLIEMKKQGDQNELLCINSLNQIIADLFFAGSDTVTNMLRWTVFFMAKHPEIRTRCQQEIDKVVPRDSPVSLLNKPDLPYVEAFTLEALRHSSLVIQNPQRCTTRDATIEGYFVPKGTSVTCDNYFIHHDPENWDRPDEFYPDRFIDSSGKCNSKDCKSLVFGSGRRQCLGEALARMEYFLFTASLLQNFNIELPPGVPLDDRAADKFGFRVPMEQKFIYKLRS